MASVSSGWARVSQCIITAITRVDCCRLDDVSLISGFRNIWMGEGKSVYHDSDHKDRLL